MVRWVFSSCCPGAKAPRLPTVGPPGLLKTAREWTAARRAVHHNPPPTPSLRGRGGLREGLAFQGLRPWLHSRALLGRGARWRFAF